MHNVASAFLGVNTLRVGLGPAADQRKLEELASSGPQHEDYPGGPRNHRNDQGTQLKPNTNERQQHNDNCRAG